MFFVYTGKEGFYFEEHVYLEAPQVIAAREMKEKEKEKKAAADSRAKWKAKGGVHIGMTKAQALASNWGKPNKVNKSSTAIAIMNNGSMVVGIICILRMVN